MHKILKNGGKHFQSNQSNSLIVDSFFQLLARFSGLENSNVCITQSIGLNPTFLYKCDLKSYDDRSKLWLALCEEIVQFHHTLIACFVCLRLTHTPGIEPGGRIDVCDQ